MPEGETDMARIKQRVKLPSGEEIWCTGESVGSLIENLLSRLQTTSSTPSKIEAPTLQIFVDSVYRPTYIDGLADTTKANYEIYLKLYILPFMGHIPMNEIMVDTLQRFYDWMAHGRSHNLNRKTIDRVGGLLSRIFKVAQAKRLIEDTPFQRILLRNNGVEAGHHKPLPDEEVTRIKKAIPSMQDERQRLYMGLLAYTGLRREEIMGLRWECVNLQAGYGEVQKVVVYPGNKVAVVKDSPKTKASERIFIIPAPLKEILEPCQMERGFVIHGRNPEEPASHPTMRRNYQAAFRHLGIDGYDNHDWRTTFGTQMKETGLTSAQVADLLGHADTRMVETVYAPARKEGILKYKDTIETMNKAYSCDTAENAKPA